MKFHPILLAAVSAALTSAHAASVSYEFTGGSLVATVTGLPGGVTASDFSLGVFTATALEASTQNALRFNGDDTTTNLTATAIGNNQILSFSLTIPSDVTLNLTSLTYDLTSSGIAGTESIYARLFTNIDGYDSAAADTIGLVGRYYVAPNPGPNSGTLSNSFVDPTLNPKNAGEGANVTAADFQNLTNQTITFYMPMVEGTGTDNTDYAQLDNITLNFTQVPEPSSALLGGLGLLALLRRRR